MAAKLSIAVPSNPGGYAQCLKMPSIIPSQKLWLPARRSKSKRLEIRASGNTFGTHFRVTTFKESRASEGCVIDGCLRGLPLSDADIQVDLDRWLGQSRITTPRKETDICKITSGIVEGLTTGAPIKIEVPSTDQIGHDYPERSFVRRPSLADATYVYEYDPRVIQCLIAGETIGKVTAGSVAKKVLKLHSRTEIVAYVSQVHDVVLPEKLVDDDSLTLDQVYSNIVRCPNPEYAKKMIAVINSLRVREGESAGGVVTCIVRNVPRGLGSLGLRKLVVELAKAFTSIPASKGLELGNRFAGSGMRTKTNLSGGIQGGVSNGEIIKIVIDFKPEATIFNIVSRDEQVVARGLNNLCVVSHACLMVQAMAELVVVNRLMAQHMLD